MSMSLDVVYALLAGAVFGGGVLLLVASLLGWTSAEPDPTRPDRKPLIDVRSTGRRLLLAIVLALVALLVTRWVTVAIGVFLIAFFAPALFGGASHARGEMARLEALASWTESLRDTIAGAVGLEQAIPATYNGAGDALKRPLGLLIDRIRTREPLPDALMKFADDLADPSADLIVAALVLNARLRGPGLRDVLTSLATAAREELDVRGRIEASRKSTRRSVQIIVALTLSVVILLKLLNPNYVKPYDTPIGQLALAVILVIFAAGFFWMRRLAQFEMPGRFLTSRSVLPGAYRTDVNA